MQMAMLMRELVDWLAGPMSGQTPPSIVPLNSSVYCVTLQK
jgi:hypothetical protein